MSDICLIEEIAKRKQSIIDAAIQHNPSIRDDPRKQWALSITLNDDPLVKAMTNLLIAKRTYETQPRIVAKAEGALRSIRETCGNFKAEYLPTENGVPKWWSRARYRK